MSEQRRLAAQKAFDRVRGAGMPMEDDPRFLVWIEQWIAGEIEMSQVRERYLGLLRDRDSELKQRALARIVQSSSVYRPESATEATENFLIEIAKG